MALLVRWVACGESLSIGLGGRVGEGVSDENILSCLSGLTEVGKVVAARRDAGMRVFSIILAPHAKQNTRAAWRLLRSLEHCVGHMPIPLWNADFSRPVQCTPRAWAMKAEPR